MKKLLAAFFISVLAAVPAHAEIIGEVLTTDIAAFIDSSPIESYNYNDYTYVVAEDLRNYGFDVEWDASARRLDISRAERNFTPYIDDFINQPKQNNLFTHAFDVYSTDIETYINNEPVLAVNIDGKTLIAFATLDAFGECSYNSLDRECYIDIMEREIEGCESKVTEGDAFTGYKAVEQGFFDENGTLLYGVQYISTATKYGEKTSAIIGNFEKGNTLEAKFSEPTGLIEETITYTTPQMQCTVIWADNSMYNMYVTQKKYAGGKSYSYLAESGEMYCEADESGSIIQLYKNGSVIASDNITADTLAMFGEEYHVLYAPGYTDTDGVIYYAPIDGSGGQIFYRGEVVNGVAHGSGTVFSDSAADFDAGNYTVVNAGESVSMTAPDVNVICQGDFFNGLPHGSVELFNYGELLYSGGAELGRKSGFGREFTSWNSNTRVLEYEGGFENGQRSGGGREYGMTFDGLWLKFDGNWQDGSYENGKWYDFNNETLQPELYYEGEFRYGEGEKQYGTHYKYYNEETNQYETKTGYFINWEYAGE